MTKYQLILGALAGVALLTSILVAVTVGLLRSRRPASAGAPPYSALLV